jgi:hypothetical protein
VINQSLHGAIKASASDVDDRSRVYFHDLWTGGVGLGQRSRGRKAPPLTPQEGVAPSCRGGPGV